MSVTRFSISLLIIAAAMATVLAQTPGGRPGGAKPATATTATTASGTATTATATHE